MDDLIIKFSLLNKGSGAGGANTYLFGKKFEELTNLNLNLNDWKLNVLNKKNKNGYFLTKKINNKDFCYMSQKGFVEFFKKILNIDLFRNPDEAMVIIDTDDKKTVKILEKKEQNVEGSVETKLWSGVALKREYELMLPDCKIEYAFCLSDYFKKKFESGSKKWEILKIILMENDIKIFYGDDPDYFEQINKWYF